MNNFEQSSLFSKESFRERQEVIKTVKQRHIQGCWSFEAFACYPFSNLDHYAQFTIKTSLTEIMNEE